MPIAHLKTLWRDIPDLLTAPNVAALTGYNENTVRRRMKEQRLRSARLGYDRITTTVWLIDFHSAGYGATISAKSPEHRGLMKMK